MKKKTLFAGAAALTLAAIIIPSTYAFGGFGEHRGEGQPPLDHPENREAVMEALDNADYDAFVEATGNTNLTEEKFEKILERHQEMEEEKADMEATHEAIKAAIENGDYDIWKSLVEELDENNPLLDVITEDNFDKLQELQQLHEQIKAIQDELGLEGPQGPDFPGRGGPGFPGRGFGPQR